MVWVWILVLLVLISWLWALILNTREKKRVTRFSRFISENAEAIMNGSSREFEGDTYRYDTVLVQYQFAVSLISVSMTRGTCLRPKKDKIWLLPSCIFISLFGGWWGLPWGPYHTILSFINNAKAREITVRELINPTTTQDSFS